MTAILGLLVCWILFSLLSLPLGVRYFVAVTALRIVASPVLALLFFISKRAFDWTMLMLRWPHFDIVLEGKLYLRRYYLSPRHWKAKLFLHHIVLPDSGRDVHSHPWSFKSLILSGGYRELVVWPTHRILQNLEIVHTAGTLLSNPASHVHRILSVKPNTWTLVLAGKAVNVWGFWVKGASGEYAFVDHRSYLGLGEEHDSVEDRVQS
jgi:hypothetical protein